MCQLMGMSANVPTDARFSFTGLVERAGRTDVHRDGWGISFYQGRGVQDFRGVSAGSDCEVAQFLKTQKIKADVVVGHIRQANVGALTLENTHPFRRELWGQYFTFAHNGQLKDVFSRLSLGRFKPVGSTDSEFIFCWLLSELEQSFPDGLPSVSELSEVIYQRLRILDQDEEGVCNVLFTDSRALLAYCSNNLHWITRKAPFGPALLRDVDLSVNFAEETNPTDIVSVIATQALTTNEEWVKMSPGEFLVFEQGEMKTQIHQAGRV